MASVARKNRPVWLNAPGLVISQLSEPLYLQKLNGGHALESTNWSEHLNDEVLATMSKDGPLSILVPYFCGFGLNYEKEQLEHVTALALRAKPHGLHIAAKISFGALTLATLAIEEPDANNWLQINQAGLNPSAPGDRDGTRLRACYNSEGYLRYLEKVCAHALEAGVDAIVFDDLSLNAEPDACHCALCVATFREFLREKYGPQNETTRQAGQERFGFNNFSHLRPPVFNPAEKADAMHLQAPLIQEWGLFKIRTLQDALARLAQFIERKAAQVAVGVCLPKIFTTNSAWRNGFSIDALFPWLDLVVDHFRKQDHCGHGHGNTDAPDWKEPARVFQIAEAFATKAFVARSARDRRFEQSCAMAICFQPATLGLATGGCLAGSEVLKRYRNLTRTLTVGRKLQRIAPTAVLRSAESLTFEGSAQRSVLALEQILLEQNLPFAPLFETQLDALNRFRVVITANVALLDEPTAEALIRYVEQGGGLLLTERAGDRDRWARKRKYPAFGLMFGPEFNAGTYKETLYGKGRVAFVPKLLWDSQTTGCAASAKGAIPRNSEEVLAALGFVGGTFFAPWTVQSASGQPLLQGFRDETGGLQLRIANRHGTEALAGLALKISLPNAPSQARILCHDQWQELPFTYDATANCVNISIEKGEAFIAIELAE